LEADGLPNLFPIVYIFAQQKSLVTTNVDALVIDPSLIDLSGHHANFDGALVSTLEELGFTSMIFGNQAFKSQVTDLSKIVQPWFRHSGYETTAFSEPSLNLSLLGDLCSLPPPKEGSVYFIQGLPVSRLLIVLNWINMLQSNNAKFVFFLMDAEYYDPFKQAFNSFYHLYQTFFSVLKETNTNFYIFAENEIIMNDYLSMGADPRLISLAPHTKPIEYLTDNEKLNIEECSTATRPIVTYLGHSSRRHKGLHLFPGAVSIALKSGIPFSMICQVDITRSTAYNCDIVNIVEQLENLSTHIDVTLLMGSLNCSKFYHILMSTDILVLPYSPYYSRNGSGLFYEGLVAGRAMVIPDYGFMGSVLERYGGRAARFTEWTMDSVALAIVHEVADYEEHKIANAGAGVRWQDDNGTRKVLENILHRL
jgi:hypothetical protein